MGFLNTIFNVVFPVSCVSCGKRGSDFCLNCVSVSPSAERESATWIFPVFDYRHPPIKKSLWLLKYKGKKKLALVFADVLYGKIMEELSDLSVMENFRASILIPIPLSKKRFRERGYNQAELICQELMKLDEKNGDLKFEKDILIKQKNGEHQAHIQNRAMRIKNIAGSFSVKNKSRIKNRNIILIDDITTTGATLGEAKKVLKESGANKIIAFTVAH
ncbi:MAG: phosphoribosyltransferase family protein [Candidatus Paceibacterota bacterium]